MFASAIRLNLSNHSFGSSVSVPPNSPGFTKLPSLGAYPPLIFIPVKAFTNAATFGSNPPGLIFPRLPPPGGPLRPPDGPPGFPPRFPPPKPPPNPPPNPGGGFWVFVGICVIVEVLYKLKPPGCPPSCIDPNVLTGILLRFTFGTPQ